MTFAQFIPQVFYDIVARIVPGSILLATFLVIQGTSALEKLTGTQGDGKSVTFLLLALYATVLAYVIAIVMEALWWLMANIIAVVFALNHLFGERDYHERRRAIRSLINEPYKEAAKVEVGAGLDSVRLLDSEWDVPSINPLKVPDIAIAYDYLRIKHPIIGSRLVKLRAEVQQCRSFALGWLIAAAMIIFTTDDVAVVGQHAGKLVPTVTLLSLSLLQFVLYTQRRKRYCWSIYNHWFLIHDFHVKEMVDDEK